jgi:hypothetical protein
MIGVAPPGVVRTAPVSERGRSGYRHAPIGAVVRNWQLVRLNGDAAVMNATSLVKQLIAALIKVLVPSCGLFGNSNERLRDEHNFSV